MLGVDLTTVTKESPAYRYRYSTEYKINEKHSRFLSLQYCVQINADMVDDDSN